MGRALAPQRRSHHHRPVISFKDPFIRHLPFVWHVWIQTTNEKRKITNGKCESALKSNSKSRNRSLVFFRVWIGEHASFELVELPNFQIGQVAHHCDISDYFRTLAQQRVDQQAALPVHRSLLTKVVRSIKELSPRRVHGG